MAAATPSAHVCTPTEGVDTLAAWLAAYLAAPETSEKVYFTVFDLLQAAGMANDEQNRSAMSRAADRSSLVQARRADGAILRAWHRPGVDMGAPASDATILCSCCHQRGLWRYELGEMTTFTAPDTDTILAWITQNTASVCDRVATCTGCGCTDDRACLGDCWWLAVDREAGKGVCSNCGDHLQAFNDQQAAARLDEQEAQARERVQAHINSAADWELMAHRIETRDIRDRMDEAIARHRRVAKAVLRRLDPSASGDPAPRIVDIGGGLVDAFDRAYAGSPAQHTHWLAQNLTWWTADNTDRRAQPRAGARP